MRLPRKKANSSKCGFCLILTAVAARDTAERLADGLVRDRLCACVSIVPGISSRYRWQGKVEDADEILLLVKTVQSQYPAIESYLKREHPYECPEIVMIPLLAGEKSYLEWISVNVFGGGDG